MNKESSETMIAEAQSSAMAHWRYLLRDEVALLAMPGAHNKALLKEAYALRQHDFIDADELGDLLELADAALAYAVESLLDLDSDE